MKMSLLILFIALTSVVNADESNTFASCKTQQYLAANLTDKELFGKNSNEVTDTGKINFTIGGCKIEDLGMSNYHSGTWTVLYRMKLVAKSNNAVLESEDFDNEIDSKVYIKKVQTIFNSIRTALRNCACTKL